MNIKDKSFFTKQLLLWNVEANGRKMPWKGEKNPYRIWLSEIILQQTRVEQGWDYYQRFIRKYPTIKKLASADETEVFKLWEGLGYYRRCKFLIESAKYIAKNLNGNFPDQYESIIKLKGVGPYTAAAIASFAFNLPYAVVDGNVYRILSRYFGISIPIDSDDGIKYFAGFSAELLDKSWPGIYNQSIMDFGATVCKPVPLCLDCPLQKKCFAFKSNTIELYPVKKKKPVRKIRWFYYIIAEYDHHILIKKREQKDIWQNLHEMILHESKEELSIDQLNQSGVFKKITRHASIIDISESYQQHLTHQTIKGRFIHVKLSIRPRLNGYKLENRSAILKLAFPKYITGYFEDSRILF
jgi:A/G-specific adenine glycosylase